MDFVSLLTSSGVWEAFMSPEVREVYCGQPIHKDFVPLAMFSHHLFVKTD